MGERRNEPTTVEQVWKSALNRKTPHSGTAILRRSLAQAGGRHGSHCSRVDVTGWYPGTTHSRKQVIAVWIKSGDDGGSRRSTIRLVTNRRVSKPCTNFRPAHDLRLRG